MGTKILNKRHAKYVKFLKSFTSTYKYKYGKSNVVVDALSHQNYLLSMVDNKTLGFEL